MPAYRVQWQQHVSLTATVTVELDELATWACEHLGMRTINDGAAVGATPAGVRRLLEHNTRMREELLQQWAAAHMPHQ